MQKTDIEILTDLLAKLPALGPRSARRAVLFLLKKKQTHLLPLINTLTKVVENTCQCSVCGNIDCINNYTKALGHDIFTKITKS